jgi:glycosyltransferase involved in cell wall biosynthesis
MTRPLMSAVIIARNEERRIEAALQSVVAEGVEEIIVVDGGSTDRTVEIAKRYAHRVIISDRGGVAKDRQLGVDAAQHDIIAMIDADHRLKPGDLSLLWDDMGYYGFDVVQSGVYMAGTGFWVQAENAAMRTFHHIPGPRTMIGTAPALYKKSVFETVRFEDTNPDVSDDADFSYRLSKAGCFRFGIGRTVIAQEHYVALSDYVKKFRWYGGHDAGFCHKHPERTLGFIYHLFVRYPIVRPLQAVLKREWRAIPYFWLCAACRISTFVPALLRRSGPSALKEAPA